MTQIASLGRSFSLLAVEETIRAIEQPINLARHDEVVLMQSFDLLGAQRDSRITPAEADVRVMAFCLGKLTNFLNKGERFPEMVESNGPLDAVGPPAVSYWLFACAPGEGVEQPAYIKGSDPHWSPRRRGQSDPPAATSRERDVRSRLGALQR